MEKGCIFLAVRSSNKKLAEGRDGLESFADVYKMYADQVYRYVLSMTGGWDQAEDLIQETF
ncbi:RNA polymerase sigma factor [Paenibacillus sinopodophylli]|uniref:RNA polymerase sigma factor n=1 Tax=Paenibacillus sinopodophylli TaxID=1837342 RepID=UPI001485DEB3|nr:sigma factor [Paenibacillus sinopodophylli]